MAEHEIEGRARELLEGKNFAHVSTLKKDGAVRNVVIWVDVDDKGRVLLNSAEGRAWPKALRRDPRVTVTVHNQDDPYEYVEIRGKITDTDTSGEADRHIDALAKKYLDQDTYPFRTPDEQRVKFVVEPDRVRHATAG